MNNHSPPIGQTQSSNLQINIPPNSSITNFNTNVSTNQPNALNYQTGGNVHASQKQAIFAPNFTTSNYSPADFNSQFSRPLNIVQATSQVVPPVPGIVIPPGNDNSSDFLKKIDEQL